MLLASENSSKGNSRECWPGADQKQASRIHPAPQDHVVLGMQAGENRELKRFSSFLLHFPTSMFVLSLGRPWPSFLPPSQRIKGRERGRWVKGGLFPFSEVMERQQKTSKPSPKLDSAGGLCLLSKGKLCVSSHCSSLLSFPSWKAHVCAGMYQAPNTVFNHNCNEWQSCNYSILLSEVLSRFGKRKLSVNYHPVYQSLPWAFSAICL